MAFQDDSREIEIRELFQLEVLEERSRQDTDAILKIRSRVIEFELKSTTEGGSVTTARDVGYSHLEKWKTKHWIVGVYDGNRLSYAVYLPPNLLLDWIAEKEAYIKPDFEISKLLEKKITKEEMYRLVGNKERYTLEDARAIQKNQMKKQEYLELMDLKDGFSKDRMLTIIHDRVNYLILRGYTLNNPHIPNAVLNTGFKIDRNHATKLRQLIR